MSVVLTHLHARGSLQEQAAPGTATVQVRDGRIGIQIGDETFDVPAGRLIAFNSGVRHSVAAMKDSTLLLTLTNEEL